MGDEDLFVGSFSIVLHSKPLNCQSSMDVAVLSGHLESYLRVAVS